MMLITLRGYGEFVYELTKVDRLRHPVFDERPGSEAQTSGGLEFDEFDVLHPAYLLRKSEEGRIHGCVRLLPPVEPPMLREILFVRLCGQSTPTYETIWESGRFAFDLGNDMARSDRSPVLWQPVALAVA